MNTFAAILNLAIGVGLGLAIGLSRRSTQPPPARIVYIPVGPVEREFVILHSRPPVPSVN